MRTGCLLLVCAGLLGVAAPARAQYKNSSFGLDFGVEVISRPSLTSNGTQLGVSNLPIRLARGYRLGGEFNLKLHEDHWFFSSRVNGKLLYYDPGSDSPNSVEAAYDAAAQAAIGTVLGIEGEVGIRYYFLTDHVRPYLQVGVSYMHLFDFTGQDSDTCTLSEGYACDGTSNNGDNFLPHTNVFVVHAPQIGIEFIVKRDIGITLGFDLQEWLVINAALNTVFVGSVGVVFYG